jgi:hypothetical protein
MFDRITRLALFAAYQTTIAVGILAMPLALLANQAGITLPVHRLVDSASSAYEAAT